MDIHDEFYLIQKLRYKEEACPIKKRLSIPREAKEASHPEAEAFAVALQLGIALAVTIRSSGVDVLYIQYIRWTIIIRIHSQYIIIV